MVGWCLYFRTDNVRKIDVVSKRLSKVFYELFLFCCLSGAVCTTNGHVQFESYMPFGLA